MSGVLLCCLCRCGQVVGLEATVSFRKFLTVVDHFLVELHGREVVALEDISSSLLVRSGYVIEIVALSFHKVNLCGLYFCV